MDLEELIKENAEIGEEADLIKKGLYDESGFTKKFLKVYRIYQVLLDKYLLTKYPLKEYDDKIANSGLLFLPVKNEQKDYFQYTSSMNLKYIYLRSNIFIEKLSNATIEKLLKLPVKELDNPSKKSLSIIESTYKDVIDYCSGKDYRGVSNYGPDIERFWFESNELIFGLIHDDFGDNGLGNDEAWVENNFKQTEFLNDLIAKMEQECSEIYQGRANVILYDEYAIKKSARSRR